MGEPEFVDNGNAPVMHADGLHDVQVIGSNCWFVLYELRRTPAGVIYREAAFCVRLPNDAVGPAIALTIRKGGASIVIPAATAAARELAMGWLH